MKKIKGGLFLFIFCVSLFAPFFGTQAAGSASLFFSPSSGTQTLNKSFTLKFMVDSGGGLGINAGEGSIKFDPTYLNVTNLSDSGTIFKLWVTDPSYSNSAGTIKFGGGLPGAYKGTAGLIFSITFSPKKIGSTKISMTSGAVLAPDGKGTDILGGLGSASFTIEDAAPVTDKPKERPKREEATKETVVKGILPPKPEIDSKTHSEKDKWYSSNNPEFSWKVVTDLTGISFSLTKEEDSDPGSDSDGIVETTRLEDIEDGEWYFHLKYKNASGWGLTSHRKVLIDTSIPEMDNVKVSNGGDPTNPSPILAINVSDKTSGLKSVKMVSEKEDIDISLADLADGKYKTKIFTPGEYVYSIIASDNAGNEASSTVRISIAPLKAPIITDIPKELRKNEELVIRGTSFYPDSTIKVFILSGDADPEVYSVETDAKGDWSYFHAGRLDKGYYEVWAQLIDERGAESSPSNKHLLTISSPSILMAYGWHIITALFLALVGLFLFLLYGRKKCEEAKERIARETDEAKSRLDEIFNALREEVDELMQLADKKAGLSESERRVKEKLQEALDISEEFIGKEIDDVKKEIHLKKEK